MDTINTETIGKAAESVVQAYTNIQTSLGFKVRCPYYRNPRSGGRRWGLIVFSGKGSPQEIEEELLMIEKIEKINKEEASEQSIISLMRKYRLGIDCSGFVFHVLNAFLKEKKSLSLIKKLNPVSASIKSKLSWFFRPMAHINVKLLTDKRNAKEIEEQTIRPGDLITFFEEIDHVAVVTKVVRNSGKISLVEYVHATLESGNGTIKEGVASYGVGAQSFKEAKLVERPETGRVITEGRGVPQFFRLLSTL